jgi:hypothetical protein
MARSMDYNTYCRKLELMYIIALMMEAARTSETLVIIQLRTWQYIPEDTYSPP